MATTIISRSAARASAAFMDAIARSSSIATLVQVLDGDTSAVLDEVQAIDGTVTLDSTAAIRGRCELTMVEIPGSLTITGNELRVCRGVTYPNGDAEVVSLGIFRPQDITGSDEGRGASFQVSAFDRGKRVEDAKFELPYDVPAGTLFTDALESLLAEALPNLQIDFATSSVVTPHLIANEGEDRWDFGLGMAESLGAELYFDGAGVAVLAAIPTGGLAVATIAEGDGGSLLRISKRETRDGSFNRVIVVGDAVDDTNPPPRGVATDDDPASPTYYYGPYGQVPDFWASEFISDQTQADDAAAGRLAKVKGIAKSISGEALVDPTLVPNEVVRITRESLGVNEDHALDSVTIPLTPDGTMSIQTRVVNVS